jgi:hypothetical protein
MHSRGISAGAYPKWVFCYSKVWEVDLLLGANRLDLAGVLVTFRCVFVVSSLAYLAGKGDN